MKQLLATHLAFKKSILTKLKEFGLKTGQPKIMYYIATHEGCRQKDIAKNCYVESATLSAVLSNMEKRGLIERKRPDSDKRAYAIYIKDGARPVFEAVERAFNEAIKQSFDGFSDKEAEEMIKYLERVENNLKTGE
ncbi:MAG: MarR family transcriptional regulator [Lachnospiraceae bacterium]|nr:MarR family transcriptional regulator [Lachnospiraceae bacterium]